MLFRLEIKGANITIKHQSEVGGRKRKAASVEVPKNGIDAFAKNSKSCEEEFTTDGTANMNILTYTEARAGFKDAMDNVCKHHDPTVITRQRGGHAVLMSLEDYNSTEETLYLLSNPHNAQRIMESIEQIKNGSTKERELITNGKAKNKEQRTS